MNKSQLKLKFPCVKKNYEYKAANEWPWKIFACNNNWRFRLTTEFTTWKYKVKLSAEAANGGVL